MEKETSLTKNCIAKQSSFLLKYTTKPPAVEGVMSKLSCVLGDHEKVAAPGFPEYAICVQDIMFIKLFMIRGAKQ